MSNVTSASIQHVAESHGCGAMDRENTKESRVGPFYRAVFRRFTHETARTGHAEGRPPGFDPFRHVVGTHATTYVRSGVASARRSARLARQRDNGAAPAMINRGLASLRGYCLSFKRSTSYFTRRSRLKGNSHITYLDMLYEPF